MTLLTHQQAPRLESDRSILNEVPRNPCPGASAIDVGAVLQAEQELDDAICELGLKSEAAMAAGDPAGARELSERMYAAIRSRTPEHQTRLHAEVEQRITDGLDFFRSPTAIAMGKTGRIPYA